MMSTKGKPPYVRNSNQSYQQAAQPAAIQSFQRAQQRYPQQPVQSQSIQLGMQPLRMPYSTQHVSMIPQTIIQTVPSQNQVRTFIPAQSSQFVPNVHSSTFDSTNQYPYVFGQGTPFYPTQSVAQQISYQATSTQQIPQNLTGTQHMQIQNTQAAHGTSQPVSVPHSQNSNSWQDKKKSVKIQIRDPKQGGKDVTNEILKIKKEGAADAPAPGIERGEQIKAEFAAKVAAAKATKENIKNSVEGNTGFQSISANQVSPELNVDEICTNDNEPEKLSTPPKCDQHESDTDISPLDNDIVMAEESSSSINVHPESRLENESGPAEVQVIESKPTDGDISQIAENDQGKFITSVANTENEISCSEEDFNKKDENRSNPEVDEHKEIISCENLVTDISIENEQNHTEDAKIENDIDKPVSELIQDNDELVETGELAMDAVEEVSSDSAAGVETESSSKKPSAIQGSRKKKPKQRIKEISSKVERDTDLMSAFTDKPTKEVEDTDTDKDVTPEEPPVVEDSWENKEIKAESIEKPEKRISYDREFLLEFQAKQSEKPKDLPDIELVLPEAHPPTKPIDKGSRMQHSGHHDFTPHFMRQASGNRQVGTGRGGKGNRALPAKKIIPTSFETKVELKKSDNAWVRPSEKASEGEENLIDDLYRKARGILNKLTPQKFQQLVEQMKGLDINTAERLKGVIDIIFEKAIAEPGFSAAYAKLCDEISKQKIQLESGKGGNITFKRILLNKCQAEFEKEKTDEQQLEKEQAKHFEHAEEEMKWQQELGERKHKAKKRSLGNIRFIGELFKLKMLTENIMHTCVVKLLRDGDEESLECLCQLLTTIGKDLDIEKAKQRTDQYFVQINKVIQQRKVCSRVVFMLQNIQELRSTNWVARRVADAPKTLDEIHQEAKQEEIEMQMAHQQAAQKRVISKSAGRESPASLRSTQVSEEGWNHVPMSNKNSRSIQPVDPSKLKLTKRTDSENISLGPGGRHSAWAQGASGGSSRFGAQPNEDGRQGNRFQALSGGDTNAGRFDTKGRGTSRSGQQSGRFGRPTGTSSSGRHSQQQFTDERAAAVENVRRIIGSSSRSDSSSKLSDDEKQDVITSEVSMETGEESSSEVYVETCNESSAVEPTEDKVRKETKLTIEEFVLNRDLKEAENCIRELKSVTRNHLIASEAINIAIEKKLDDVKSIRILLDAFIKAKLISIDDFKIGLTEVLEYADDISVDIPHIWTNLGIIMSFIIVENLMSLSEFSMMIEHLIRCNKAALLMAQVLTAASQISDKATVAALWHKSDLSWEKLLNEENGVEHFLSKYDLEFTISRAQETLENGLFKLLEDSCTCNTAVEWIEGRSLKHTNPFFIRELCTTVFRLGLQNENSVTRFDPDAIKNYKDLLAKYIDNIEKELEALFAAQCLAETLKHPQDFFKSLFDALYDEELISGESIMAWEKSEAQPQGKGMAIDSVKGFLQWLKDSDNDKTDQ